LGRVQRPRSRRRSEIEHALTFSKKIDPFVDRFELEHAARRKAALFRIAGETIGFLVGVGAPRHGRAPSAGARPAYLAFGLPPFFLTAPRTVTMPLRGPGMPQIGRASCCSGTI